MIAAVARVSAPIALAVLVACVWLNQGVGRDDWDAYRDRVSAAPREHVLDFVRAPFAYLYKQASDIQLYYEVAGMILGRPTDAAFVSDARGALPSRFVHDPPPADGRWHAPYEEVFLEYPAAALPFILAPRLVTTSPPEYGLVFGAVMGLFLVCAVIAALGAANTADVDEAGLRKRAWLASGLLLAQGAIAVQRLDATTALWLMLAVYAAVRRKPIAFGAWAGLATASKFVPALMLPAIMAADASFWRSSRPLSRFAAGFGVAFAAGIVPMFVFSGHALADVIAYHSARGLDCESTLGFLLAVWRLVTGTRLPSTIAFGSYNLHGPGAGALAAASEPLSIAALAGLAWVFWRDGQRDQRSGERGPERVACAAFAALVHLWLTGKAFSTQYMTWGIPLVLAIPGRVGVKLAWLLVGAMGLTQLYVCGHHELVVQGRPLGLLNLGARQALLAAAGYLAARNVRGLSKC